jgi:hypothetical protein
MTEERADNKEHSAARGMICHDLKKPLAEAWPRWKIWD